MAGKSGTGRATKQLRNNTVGKKDARPALVGSKSKKENMPRLITKGTDRIKKTTGTKVIGTKSKTNYLGNAAKEVGELGSAWKKASNAAADIMPGANARARAANRNQRAQMGQALGAVLQGRRYTNAGKQIKGK